MTKTYALVGYPLTSSFSPQLHEAAFKYFDLPAKYILLPTPSENLSDVISDLRAGKYAGLNVTIPHKLSIVSLLDELRGDAKQIGAVNTVATENGKLIGYNTDAAGFAAALICHSEVNPKNPPEHPGGSFAFAQDDIKTITILGSGGAARAVAFALSQLGVKDIRCVARQNNLANCTYFSWDKICDAVADADLIINTTPLGSTGKPWPDLAFLESTPKHAVIYDLIAAYQTEFTNAANQLGRKTQNGLSMLTHQAALAFEIWTGKKLPIEVMGKILS